MIEWFKAIIRAVMEWIGMANTKVDEVQEVLFDKYEMIDLMVDDMRDKVYETVDDFQEDLGKVKEALAKAIEEDKA